MLVLLSVFMQHSLLLYSRCSSCLQGLENHAFSVRSTQALLPCLLFAELVKQHWRERAAQRQRYWSLSHGFQRGRALADWGKEEGGHVLLGGQIDKGQSLPCGCSSTTAFVATVKLSSWWRCGAETVICQGPAGHYSCSFRIYQPG